MVYKREIGNFCIFLVFFFFSWHKEKGVCNEINGKQTENQYKTVFFHPAVSSGIHCLGNLLKPEVQYVYKNIRRLVWVK